MLSAKIRDHLANERTFLAWVRTSVSLLGFGVLIARLALIMDTMGEGPVQRALPTAGHGGRTLLLGLLFCVVGLITLVFSTVEYLQSRQTIETESYVPPGRTLIAFTVIVSILAVASIIVLLQIGE
jgi:putative membrane protein